MTERVFVDKQHPRAYQALLDVAKAARAAAREAGLDRGLVELVNLRVSQLNRCAYCLALHTEALHKLGETRLAVLPAWDETDLFSPVESAALRLAESLTTLPDTAAQDAAYAQAAEVLTPDQLSAVEWVVVTINAFNRVSIGSRHPVTGLSA
ncbi:MULTISPECIES: carboxymuconolactone decarboxylase family protein [Amycolatopsis]|uniref:Alkylhydroperoxidase AhpD family core domain-containing protein n=2 Tax=Amycolatopsis TaxID=1813 RepID=A0A1I3XGS4_9PSEU|nr:carboxymuconolactone decarboxylase family protein [Amycolatopsis sacchari]SFK18256.1 alkylhydroperoxidase AhpD family core domain-containing protein [Amycolatopsis sacchari]